MAVPTVTVLDVAGAADLAYAALAGGLALLLLLAALLPGPMKKLLHWRMASRIQEGDYVLTSGGLYGIVKEVGDRAVVVEFGMDPHCRIPVSKKCVKKAVPPVPVPAAYGDATLRAAAQGGGWA